MQIWFFFLHANFIIYYSGLISFCLLRISCENKFKSEAAKKSVTISFCLSSVQQHPCVKRFSTFIFLCIRLSCSVFNFFFPLKDWSYLSFILSGRRKMFTFACTGLVFVFAAVFISAYQKTIQQNKTYKTKPKQDTLTFKALFLSCHKIENI